MSSSVKWRQTGRYLWVGARHDRHVGVIEQGRRFTAVDHEGVVRGRFATLNLAQDALA